ncbi:PF11158 family protein [Bacteriovorax sp. BSW11_IV]|uniref:DUF2938 family protein n=1 Tax=Bacteriovorax sp. BSW11_IV TaxID=1353529 RepID=UPI000389E098|nr:DUF2938 family protein [Bacteriovorax sp. BSW11_IV]EQC48686.1 PF11158 family protein [Bacteriovorax sp. BSW11_IV]
MSLFSFLASSLIVGLIATLFMDLWALIMSSFFNIKGLDYKILGRWISLMSKGHFKHNNILNMPAAVHEQLVGQMAHYIIGILFAGILIIIDVNCLVMPNLTLSLMIALLTLVAPFLIMQPCFGFGIAASKTQHPWHNRLKSLMAHIAYGIGLYLACHLIAIVK